MEGLIIKNISDLYVIKSENKYYNCKAKGIFRNKHIIPVVGDKVLFDKEKLVITEILNRKNELIRPMVSNVDQAFIVTSTINPSFSTYLIDKLILLTEYNNIKPILIISKVDLNDEYDNYLNYYKKLGYIVVKNNEIDKIKKLLENKITVITGQSGVGKSTLLNKLDSNLSLKTNEISYALGRGKHTTRHTEIFEVANGYIIDTPGFSSLELPMTKEDIRDNFIEFDKYKDKCKYRDCMHLNETECMIKELVKSGEILKSRYENYTKFISEIKSIY